MLFGTWYQYPRIFSLATPLTCQGTVSRKEEASTSVDIIESLVCGIVTLVTPAPSLLAFQPLAESLSNDSATVWKF